MHKEPTVLVIDDDPAHLRIYGWIIERAGYKPILAQVEFTQFQVPCEHADLVLLDYNLTGNTTAVEVAKVVRGRLPEAPIVMLSDLWGVPDDIAPYVSKFVRKGEPAKLVATLQTMLQPSI